MDKHCGGAAGFCIRPAVEDDVPAILHFIRELAAYENMSGQVIATEELLREWIFEKKKAEVLIAEEVDAPVGFALFFHNFSTFLGRAGIYLEDLFVLPEKRGHGYGKALLERLAALAVERGCGRLEWSCLDWNQPSIDFYRSMGAVPMDGWTVYRLTGDTLRGTAQRSAAARLALLPLEEAYFDDFSRVHALSWQVAYRGILSDDFLAERTPENRAAALRSAFPQRSNEHSFLVHVDNVPAGVLTLALPEEAKAGEIKAFYLLKEFQGQGFGTAMMNAALQKLRTLGCREVFLWVLEENRTARAFYERHGFSDDGGRKDLMIDRMVPAVRYRRQIV